MVAYSIGDLGFGGSWWVGFNGKRVVPLGGEIDFGGSSLRFGDRRRLFVALLFLIFFRTFGRLGGGDRPGSRICSIDRNLRNCFFGCGGFRDYGTRSSDGAGTLFVTSGKLTVTGSFLRISSFGIDVLQSTAADASFGET